MKNFLLALSMALGVSALISLNACKKTTDTENDEQSATDNNTVTSAVNLTGNDASGAAGQITSFSGKTQGLYAALCGVQSIDSSGSTITITYDGTTRCFDLIRSGSISVTLNGTTKWRDATAQLTVTYNNLSVTDLSGQTFTINGSQTLTNVSGGLAWQIAYGIVTNDSVIHSRTANMTITFPNGSKRSWTLSNFMRKWVGTGSGTNLVVTVTDYTSSGAQIITGTNRFGNSFTTSITSPVISNSTCDYFPYAGTETHTVDNRTATINFGYNASGTPIGSATSCFSGLEGLYITYFNTNGSSAKPAFVLY